MRHLIYYDGISILNDNFYCTDEIPTVKSA
jgi:hypothetical protein